MSSTQTGMQQKEGTNYDGPKPVESAAPLAYAAGAFARLAMKIDSAAPLPVVKRVNPAAEAQAAQDAAAAAAATATAAVVPIVATAVTTLPDHPNLSVVVLDSGALISSGSVSLHATSAGFELLARIYRENDARTRFVTTQAVINEIKDEKTREMLENLPFKIEVLAVDPNAIKECYRFATLTGDAKTLSATDIQIIALQYQLEKQHNGMTFIKTEPTRSKAMDAINAATSAPAPTAAPTATAAASATDAEPTTETNDGHEEHESDDEEDAAAEPIAVSESAASTAVDAAPEAAADSKEDAAAATTTAADDDGEDGEGAWITPSNIHEKRTRPAPSLIPESSIAVITTDYAMQNVLLQLGLRLLNLRGRSIRSIRSWQKKCHACGALSPDMSREFCSSCGGHTMIRVNVTVNKAGLVRYWHGTRHLNLRGTIYSIPMPRAGRHANNLKLSEDVIDERIRKGGGLMGRTGDGGKARDHKTPTQLFEDGIEFGMGRTGPNSNQHTYGYGRKNPNAQKGGKKKGKK